MWIYLSSLSNSVFYYKGPDICDYAEELITIEYLRSHHFILVKLVQP